MKNRSSGRILLVICLFCIFMESGCPVDNGGTSTLTNNKTGNQTTTANRPQANLSINESLISPMRSELEMADGIVTNIWLGMEHNDTNARLDVLRENKIRYLIIDAGDTGQDGMLETPKSEIEYFLEVINSYELKQDYFFVLLPYSEINTYDYNITRSGFLENFVSDYGRLYKMGFDGVFVDIEPARFEQRELYLQLLDTLRKRLGSEAIISLYAGSIVEQQGDSPNEWEWESSFYSAASDRVDLISMQGYDTDSRSSSDYENFVKEQIKILASHDWNSKFLFGVPSHKNPPETLSNALSAYKEGLALYYNKNNKSSPLLGVALFAEWTTDTTEWKEFNKYHGI